MIRGQNYQGHGRRCGVGHDLGVGPGVVAASRVEPSMSMLGVSTAGLDADAALDAGAGSVEAEAV